MLGIEVQLPGAVHRVTVRNMGAVPEREGYFEYRVIVDDGEDLFMVYHERSEGYELLLANVFQSMYMRRCTRASRIENAVEAACGTAGYHQ